MEITKNDPNLLNKYQQEMENEIQQTLASSSNAPRLRRRRIFQIVGAAGLAGLAYFNNPLTTEAKPSDTLTHVLDETNMIIFNDLLPEGAIARQILVPNEIPARTQQTSIGHRLVTQNTSNESGSYQAALNPDLFDHLSSIPVPQRLPTITIIDNVTQELIDANVKLTISAFKLFIPSQEQSTFGIIAGIGPANKEVNRVLRSKTLSLETANELNLLQIGWERSGSSALPGPDFNYANGFNSKMEDYNIFPNRPILLPGGIQPR